MDIMGMRAVPIKLKFPNGEIMNCAYIPPGELDRALKEIEEETNEILRKGE
jgi:hypothetical protein